MEPSKFMIGILVVGLVASLFMLGVANVQEHYTITNYDPDDYQTYSQLSELQNITDETREQALDIQDSTEGTDLVGITMDAIATAKIAIKSLDTFSTIAGSLFNEEGQLGESGALLFSYIVAIVIVAVVLGGIIAAVLKYKT